MKLFIYKSFFVFFAAFLLFQLTVGTVIKNYERKIDTYFSKQSLEYMKSKMRKEIENAIEKENYLKPEDALLINKFLKKLEKEIFSQNQ